jgi:hypothetical protein
VSISWCSSENFLNPNLQGVWFDDEIYILHTSSTYCLPLPMIPKFCEVATANRDSKNGLNFTCKSPPP